MQNFVNQAITNYRYASGLLAAARQAPDRDGSYGRYRIQFHEANVLRCLDNLWVRQELVKELTP